MLAAACATMLVGCACCDSASMRHRTTQPLHHRGAPLHTPSIPFPFPPPPGPQSMQVAAAQVATLLAVVADVPGAGTALLAKLGADLSALYNRPYAPLLDTLRKLALLQQLLACVLPCAGAGVGVGAGGAVVASDGSSGWASDTPLLCGAASLVARASDFLASYAGVCAGALFPSPEVLSAAGSSTGSGTGGGGAGEDGVARHHPGLAQELLRAELALECAGLGALLLAKARWVRGANGKGVYCRMSTGGPLGCSACTRIRAPCHASAVH